MSFIVSREPRGRGARGRGMRGAASLGPVERAWMGLAGIISKVTTPIFMSVVYFVVLTPVGLLRRCSPEAPSCIGPAGSRFLGGPRISPRGSLDRQF